LTRVGALRLRHSPRRQERNTARSLSQKGNARLLPSAAAVPSSSCPPLDADRQRIDAKVELAGLPATAKSVARSQPLSIHLARITHLRGHSLVVLSTHVVSPSRYEIIATCTRDTADQSPLQLDDRRRHRDQRRPRRRARGRLHAPRQARDGPLPRRGNHRPHPIRPADVGRARTGDPALPLLIVLGVALVALGALVLLRFPDRPGGEIRLLGLQVSSIGAGLPLIALGVLVSVVVGSEGRNAQPSSEGDSGGAGGLVSGPPPDDAPRCVAKFFGARPRVSAHRQRTLPTGVEDVEVLAPEESKREEFGLVLTADDQTLGAVKMRYDDATRRFGVDAIVDARCEPVRWAASDVPGTTRHRSANSATCVRRSVQMPTTSS
jgi:hypothetical protein